MFLRKFLNKKNLVNIFKKFINYEIYGIEQLIEENNGLKKRIVELEKTLCQYNNTNHVTALQNKIESLTKQLTSHEYNKYNLSSHKDAKKDIQNMKNEIFARNTKISHMVSIIEDKSEQINIYGNIIHQRDKKIDQQSYIISGQNQKIKYLENINTQQQMIINCN